MLTRDLVRPSPIRSLALGMTVLTLGLVLTACTSSVPLNQSNTGTGASGSAGAAGSSSMPDSGKSIFAGESAVKPVVVDASGNTQQLLNELPKVIYFDYDSFSVNADAMPVVEGYGKVLSGSTSQRLLLEGHTDERGGREYNLALGQKRAEAVLRALTVLGATTEQLEAVSLGEEQPAVQGSDETAWSKNRRVEFRTR